MFPLYSCISLVFSLKHGTCLPSAFVLFHHTGLPSLTSFPYLSHWAVVLYLSFLFTHTWGFLPSVLVPFPHTGLSSYISCLFYLALRDISLR